MEDPYSVPVTKHLSELEFTLSFLSNRAKSTICRNISFDDLKQEAYLSVIEVYNNRSYTAGSDSTFKQYIWSVIWFKFIVLGNKDRGSGVSFAGNMEKYDRGVRKEQSPSNELLDLFMGEISEFGQKIVSLRFESTPKKLKLTEVSETLNQPYHRVCAEFKIVKEKFREFIRNNGDFPSIKEGGVKKSLVQDMISCAEVTTLSVDRCKPVTQMSIIEEMLMSGWYTKFEMEEKIKKHIPYSMARGVNISICKLSERIRRRKRKRASLSSSGDSVSSTIYFPFEYTLLPPLPVGE